MGSFSLFLLLLLTFPTAHACPTVADFVQAERARMLLLSRRGVSRQMTTSFFRAFITHLIDYVDYINPDVLMADVCMNTTRQTQFSGFYDRFRIDQEIQEMLKADPHLHYLPPQQIPDKQIPPLRGMLKKREEQMWKKALREMRKHTARNVDVGKVQTLPGGPAYFYDPMGVRACTHYKEQRLKSNGVMGAARMLFEVVAIVMRLHIIGVDDKKSVQMLSHHLAFTFKAIRCVRKERDNLSMPCFFLPWYRRIADRLVADAGGPSVPDIPVRIVRKYLRTRLTAFATYESWGKVVLFEFNGMDAHKVNISDYIFDPAIIRRISLYIGKLSGHNQILKPRLYLPAVERTECEVGMFLYSSYAGDHVSFCCPVVCQMTYLMSLSISFGTATCCQEFNNDPRSDSLMPIANVHVDPYGLAPGTSVSIVI